MRSASMNGSSNVTARELHVTTWSILIFIAHKTADLILAKEDESEIFHLCEQRHRIRSGDSKNQLIVRW